MRAAASVAYRMVSPRCEVPTIFFTALVGYAKLALEVVLQGTAFRYLYAPIRHRFFDDCDSFLSLVQRAARNLEHLLLEIPCLKL